MVRYLFYTIGNLTYQSPLVLFILSSYSHISRLFQLESTPFIVPMFVHRNLSRCIGGGGKWKCYITGNFFSQTFMGTRWEWRYIGGELFDCALSVHLVFVVDKVALRQVFPANTSASTCQYHSTNAPYSFIYHHRRYRCLAVESVVQ